MMQGSNSPSNVSPSWTWGSSGTITFDLTGEPGQAVAASVQLAQISLPEPAVCSCYVQASFFATVPRDDYINILTVNLLEGIGRVTVPRQISFQNQPSNRGPLEFTLPFLPVHALQVNVEAVLNHSSEDPTNQARVELFFVLAPLTRIPQKLQQLQFGMALPGEADDLDDELRGELEAEGPTVAAMMGEGRQHVDGSSPEEPDDEPDDEPEQPPPAVLRSPPWLLTLVDQMTRRLGREPTRSELARAVKRVRTRMARR